MARDQADVSWWRRGWRQAVWEGPVASVRTGAGVTRPGYHVWIVIDMRRALPFGWWVTRKFGPVRQRDWYLHAGTARVAYRSATLAAAGFMDSLIGLARWQASERKERQRVEPWC